MKILALISSYRQNGNTARVISLIEEQLKAQSGRSSESIEFEKINLGHVSIQPCRGCRICFDKGEDLCPLKDDLLYIRDKIALADGIILASPVYVEDVSGIMKNWIDRMAFNSHRPGFSGKAAIVITTSGIGSSNHSLNTMKAALTGWGFRILGGYKFKTGALMSIVDMEEKYNNRITTIADVFFNILNMQKPYNPTFYSLIAFRVQQKYWQKRVSEKDSIAYGYWSNKGWLKKDCEFYTSNSASWIKVKLSRILGDIIAIFFI